MSTAQGRGDVLRVESEVIEVIPSRSRPDHGTVVVRSETRNGRGEVVQITTMKLLVPCRERAAYKEGSGQTTTRATCGSSPSP
jgi:hypothetical protein